jgi:hypothetical protein
MPKRSIIKNVRLKRLVYQKGVNGEQESNDKKFNHLKPLTGI